MTIHDEVLNKIINKTIELIEEADGNLKKVTTRAIAERANVAVGAINYYFKSKDQLIELSLQQKREDQRKEITLESFLSLREEKDAAGFAKQYADLLFLEEGVSQLTIIETMKNPGAKDATAEILADFAQFFSEKDSVKAFLLVSVIQQAFLRKAVSSKELGINFEDKKQRDVFIEKLVNQFV